MKKIAGWVLGAFTVCSCGWGGTAPELLFRATFNGTAEAMTAKGGATPLAAKNLEFAPGVEGQALRVTGAAKSLLAYAEPGNLVPERGTISLWTKNEWPDRGMGQKGEHVFRYLLANRCPNPRNGSGALFFWWYGTTLRADQSDDADSHQDSSPFAILDGAWHHLAFTWDEKTMGIFVDGKAIGDPGDGFSPMRRALKAKGSAGTFTFADRKNFDRFFVGSREGMGTFDGLIDDLRIYSAPLDPASIAALAQEYVVPRTNAAHPDYAKLYARTTGNPYVGAPSSAPGTFAPEDLELVDEVKIATAADVEALKTAHRFNSIGALTYGALAGQGYLEADRKKGGRFALRFTPPASQDPFYVFDIDYPDDKVRTVDILVHPAQGSDYAMQCGVAAGGEYANTGRVLTHRVIWWAHPGDVAVVAMTARNEAPAAISAVRLYRVKSRTLPPTAVHEPKANADGWRRSIALYYEDPAIGTNFSVPGGDDSPESIGETIDRTIATMRFTGENLFCYPGAWYHGLIGEKYNPRQHAPDFLSAWYAKFDAEGDLSVAPTLNINDLPVPNDLVTLETMTNGALHASVIAIHDTGKPNWGGWHGSPPNFNIAHPQVQAELEKIVDTLLEQGVKHSSFKGIALHAPRHSLVTFGGIESGYNDYCIDAFARATGVKVPCDRTDPLRGAAYAAWIREHALAQWLDWRCDVVAAFWGRIARKLKARRPDLKLWIHSFGLSNPKHADWSTPEYVRQINREMGIDAAKLTTAAPNLILSQCIYPADPRWRGQNYFRNDPAAWEKMLNYHAQAATYRLLEGEDFPWVGQHDRYWESPIGRTKQTLTCDWLKECVWRVSTINPSGVHALRHFVVPLRFNDVLGMSKGGFLVGTYGMEPYLARFAQAFRTLPAVKMREVFHTGNVVARQVDFDGKSYFYVVNTDPEAKTLNLNVPADTVDLVTGARVGTGGKLTLNLAPYDLRSFSAPRGCCGLTGAKRD